jgi:hypothetical protein
MGLSGILVVPGGAVFAARQSKMQAAAHPPRGGDELKRASGTLRRPF